MTTLQRFDPFRRMPHFSRVPHFSPMFNHPLRTAHGWNAPLANGVDHSEAAWWMPMDVFRNEKELTVCASLPGFGADDIDVSISPDRVLSVKACWQPDAASDGAEYLMRERRYGNFYRTLRLPSDLDLDGAAVALEDGVLTVTLPVAETAQTRRLSISNPNRTDNA